jgi:protein involved in temperature-dependent protein secretion
LSLIGEVAASTKQRASTFSTIIRKPCTKVRWTRGTKVPTIRRAQLPAALSYEKLEFDFAVADGGRLEAAQEFRDQSETFTILAYLIERLDTGRAAERSCK